MEKKGIDVSHHNGNVSWKTVKTQIDFAIIRAGYGAGNQDRQFENNVMGCIENDIPFGLYWFSYAYTPELARKEADYLCIAADRFSPTYPVFIDFEYGSDDYADREGYTLTNEDRVEIVSAFVERVKERGYAPAIYTNPDYMNRGLKDVVKKYGCELWLANWNVKKPLYECDIWQYTPKGKVTGISTAVDMNICYKEYVHEETEKEKKLKKLTEDNFKKYYKEAQEVWKGNYGAGEERKKKVQEAGLDYDYLQGIVNII